MSRVQPQPGTRTAHGSASGFTLLEILVAATVGVILITAVAEAVQRFGDELGYIRDEKDVRAEEVLQEIIDRVRDGWWVETPTVGELKITDPYGSATRFVAFGSALYVVRPNDATGALLDGLASATFSVDTTRRLRDIAPVDIDGTWFSRPAPVGAPVEIVLTEGDALSVGFHMSARAPDAVKTVSDVDEVRLQAELGQVVLALSFLDGSLKEFCHLHASPPHNPSHPGYPGGKLIVDLHEARAPDDGRPHGASLGTLEVPASELPPTAFVWWDPNLGDEVLPPDAQGAGGGPNQCHDDDADGECDHPGNNPHHNPLDAPGGVAWGWWNNHPDVELIITPTTVAVPVDLSAFGVPIEPGRAYTLVFSVAGWDEVRVAAVPSMSPFTAVAMQTGGGSFVPQPLAIALNLTGPQTCTQTEAHDVASRVTVTLQTDDGKTVSGSASVSTQTSVDDPWRGVAPGEMEVLEL